jgi:PP-loop superfamily ATP-utilizing enzyme
VRVRHHGTRARLELDAHGLQEAEAPAARRLLIEAVRSAGFAVVVIDPRGYRPAGSAVPSRTAPA